MRALVILPLLLLIPFSMGEHLELSSPLPFNSIGASDDALAVFLNPAGLAFNRGLNGYYLRGYRGAPDGRNTFAISAYGMGFGLQMIEGEGDKLWRWTLSSGKMLGDHLAIGTAYSWFSAEDEEIDKLKIWDVGGMFRTTHLSTGILLRNLNRPKLRGERLDPEFRIGVAFRPVNDRVTLSFDAGHTFGERGWRIRVGAELVPVDGLTFRGSVDRERNFDLLFALNLSHIGFGSYNTLSKKEIQDGIGYIYLSAPFLPTVFSRRREVIRLNANNSFSLLPKAVKDDRVVGAIINLDDIGYGLGNLQELEGILRRFRRSGRKVFAYSTTLSTGGYLAASACDRIILHPLGELRLIGIRSESIFIKQMLDELGIEANIERFGKYKSAPETFTREEMSSPSREEMESVLDDLFDQIITTISRNRGITPERLKKLIDNGPYTAQKARELNLVDDLAYKDEIEELVRKELGRVSLVEGSKYAKSERFTRSWKVPPKLALIKAKGVMVSGESFTDPLTGNSIMGSKTVSEALRKAREDDTIKAVILRIDSGGGMVLAADEIWREVKLTGAKKPVVVSMGDIAASGGYYIATPADYIFAQPTTLTGSIGVFSGVVNLRRFYERIGLNKEILKRGENADFYSDWSEFTPRKREILRSQVKEIYDDFVEKVSQGRRITRSKVEGIAQGRVWTGRQAKELGLVDEIGGLEEAISKAKELAGIRRDEEVELIGMPSEKLTDFILRKLMERSWILRFIKMIDSIREQKLLLITPYTVKVSD